MSLPDHDAIVEYVNSVYDAAKSHEFALPSAAVLKVRQEVRIHVDPGVPRNCRWCGGNGLDPFLPSPVRVFFTCSPWFLTAGLCTCRSVEEGWHAVGCRAIERDMLLRDVNEWDPLNEWLDVWLDESRGRSDIAATPFDLIGMSYMRVRCKRCRGTGRRTLAVEPVAVLHS